MCLAVPGKIVTIRDPDDPASPGALGTVDFQGSRLEVSLAFTPEAQPGDWVLVHAGFALNVLDEAEARETWQYLQEANLAEMPDELRPDS
jgi:hydrogenase expression/formation protein HypC